MEQHAIGRSGLAAARRQRAEAELISVDARDRIREAEQAIAARELLSALEGLVESRLGAVADTIRQELSLALTAETARLGEDLANAQAAGDNELGALIDDMRTETERARVEAARAGEAVAERARVAEEEIRAGAERAGEELDGRLQALTEDAELGRKALEERIVAALQAEIETRLAAQIDAWNKERKELEDRLMDAIDTRFEARTRAEERTQRSSKRRR